jgi:hypothetical protein
MGFSNTTFKCTFDDCRYCHCHCHCCCCFRVLAYDPIVERSLLPPDARVASGDSSSSSSSSGKNSNSTVKKSSSSSGGGGNAQRGRASGAPDCPRTVQAVQSCTPSPNVRHNAAARPPNCIIGSTAGAPRGLQLLALRFAGLCSAFGVSAAWHALLYWLLTGKLDWHWPAFFIAQPPLLLLERCLRTAWRATRLPDMPAPLAVVSTNIVLLLLAEPLLLMPLVSSGAVDSMLAQSYALLRAAASAVLWGAAALR